jgi:hypothetical protein
VPSPDAAVDAAVEPTAAKPGSGVVPGVGHAQSAPVLDAESAQPDTGSNEID